MLLSSLHVRFSSGCFQSLYYPAGLGLLASALISCTAVVPTTSTSPQGAAAILVHSSSLTPLATSTAAGVLRLDGLYLETASGRLLLPPSLTARGNARTTDSFSREVTLDDGRVVKLSLQAAGPDRVLRLSAIPSADIRRWGLAVETGGDEHFSGAMERVEDGPQQVSWAPGQVGTLDLRGQKVEMILKPTTAVYAPFFLSSRGYALFVKGDWPGLFDFCASDPARVKVEFEGPSFEMKIYTSANPAALVCAHALEAGPPFLPPLWMFSPWRWRDEVSQLREYFDNTQVTAPFNSQILEDVLLMKAYGIPCSVYWIDRPWGPGALGYDDFEIDSNRLPYFREMVRWLDQEKIKTALWIGPFLQGKMAEEGLAKGYTLAGQQPQRNNYPLVDLSNPSAKAYWQSGVEKLLRLGVAGFKLDRGEEEIPESGPFKIFDGRSIRENRNAYPRMYLKATYDIARKVRGDDFVLMPRAAYTGSAPYGIFWGGDIGGTPEGLRASIIAAQRAAVMGYPVWGSDTCGYTKATLEHELCARWLAFSCFTPLMEVGPTRNVAFWSMPHEPSYDAELIAVWRFYARLHDRLATYSRDCAEVAHRTGLPIIRPLFFVDKSPSAWTHWETYLYGPDLLVSPLWEIGKRQQEVYLPAGYKWRDGWSPEKIYEGGQVIKTSAELNQIPIFVRVGARLQLGDLHQEYAQSLSIAKVKPDLKALDASVKIWFEHHVARSATARSVVSYSCLTQAWRVGLDGDFSKEQVEPSIQ